MSSPPRPQPQAPLRLPPAFWHVTASIAAVAAVVMLSTHRNAQFTAAGLTQRDLGQRLSLTSGAVTMLVDRLERAGWVHRRPHPGDRRFVLIELSPLAAASAPEGLAAYHARIRALAAGVPAAQREAVAAFLAAAADAAAAAAAELSADRRNQPDVSRASRLPASGRQLDRPCGLPGPAGRPGAAGTSAAPRIRVAAR